MKPTLISNLETGKQPLDGTLGALAALAWTAGTQIPVLTGTDITSLKTVGQAAGNILDKAAGDALYQALGSYQPLDATLTSLAALSWTSGKQVPIFTAADTTSFLTVGQAAGNILDKAAGDALYAPIAGGGYQASDATLTALAALNATVGILEQTGTDTFTKRAIGVAAATDLLTRADGDSRFTAVAHATSALTASGHTVSATARILGRNTAGAGAVEELSGTTTTALLDLVIAGGAKGLMSGADKTRLDGMATGATANTGTVTSVAVTANNGITQSVTNGTTAAVLTLGLGAITPTSVASTGAVSGTSGSFTTATVSGASSGLFINTRDTGSAFQLYNTGGVLGFHNGSNQLTLGATGNLTATGTVTGIGASFINAVDAINVLAIGTSSTAAADEANGGEIDFRGAGGGGGNSLASVRGVYDSTLNAGILIFRTALTERARLSSDGLTVANDILANNFKGAVYSRTVSTTAADTVNVCTITQTNLSTSVEVTVTVHAAAFKQTKVYLLPLRSNYTGTNWNRVVPISNTEGSDNVELDIQVNGDTATLRLRRTAGTNAATAQVSVRIVGDIANTTLTSSATTAAAGTVTADYAFTSMEQLSNNTVRVKNLEMRGQAAPTFNLYNDQTLAGTISTENGGVKVSSSGGPLRLDSSNSNAVQIGHNGATVMNTAASGVDITGDLSTKNSTGGLYVKKSDGTYVGSIKASTNDLLVGTTGVLKLDGDAGAQLMYAAAAKLATSATGVSVTGTLAATGAVTGSNLSGTNTGDQNLSGYALLGGAAFTGAVGFGAGLSTNRINVNTINTTGIELYVAYNDAAPLIKLGSAADASWVQLHAANKSFAPTNATWDLGASATRWKTVYGIAGDFSGAIVASNFTGTSTGTNTGDQTTVSGNAGSATVLQTARLINGTSFNGSADITITANNPNGVTFNNSGAGAVSGTSYNGSSATTVSYNTIGAQVAGSYAAATHTHAYTDVNNVTTGTLFYRKTAGTGAAELQTLATLKTDLGLTGTNSGDQTITLTGPVTGSGTGSFATSIATNVVTLANLSQVATATFLGRTTAATGNVEALTTAQATALLDSFSSTLKGLVPASGGGTTNFLRADGTWIAPPASGSVTSVSVTTSNGVSGTVATPSTTPAITLTLGAITPTSVAATGTVTGSNLSGTNTGDQTTITGNAGTATVLQTARTINGVSFNGSANITINAVDSTARIAATEKGAANGVATLGADSKIPSSQLPALAITSTFVVASQVAQLALTSQEGDVAVRTDLNKSFINNGGVAGTMADWQELLTPTDQVLSVNGLTGAVTISTITGNAGSATVLQTARNINGTSFNGSADITITANNPNAVTFNSSGTGAVSGTSHNGSAATTVSYNTIGAQVAGSYAAATHTHAYTDVNNVTTGTLFYRKTAGTGAAELQTLATLKTDLGLAGTNSGDQTSVSGSAGSVVNSVTFNSSGTGAATGTTFNGSAAQTISYNTIGAQPAGSYATLSGATFTGKVFMANPTASAVFFNMGYGGFPGTNTVDGDMWGNSTGLFFKIAGNNYQVAPVGHVHAYSDITSGVTTGSIFYRKSAGTGGAELQTLATLKTDLGLTGTNSGDQTTITGNAGTATTLQTARLINGTSFNGSADITITAATPNALTFTSAAGDAAATTFNGSAARSIGYASVGAPSTTGTNASGTWAISISGNAATSTTSASATVSSGLKAIDNRAIDDTPAAKTGQQMSFDFKNNTSVSSPPVSANGNFSYIMTAAGWDNGGSGGWPTQVSYGDGLAVRQATSGTVWGPWRKMYHDGNLVAFTSGTAGLVPASGGGTTNYLRADGTWQPVSSSSGTVTSVSVTSANGISGTVATSTTTPAITLSLGAITPTSIVSSGEIIADRAASGAGPNPSLTAKLGTYYISQYARMTAGNYNPIVALDDSGVIFSTGTTGTGAFVIAPWSASAAGLRMTATGATTLTGSFTATGSVTAPNFGTSGALGSYYVNTRDTGSSWQLYNSGGTLAFYDTANRLTLSSSGATITGTLNTTGTIVSSSATAAAINLTKTGTNAGTAVIYNDGALHMVAGTGQGNFYNGDGHTFTNQAQATTYGVIGSSGLSITGAITATSNISLLSNSAQLLFKDVSATSPYFVCQGDNNFVFYNTSSTGAARAIWSSFSRSDTSAFQVNPPIIAADNISIATYNKYLTFGSTNAAPPTVTTTRSLGTKIVLYDNFANGVTSDYAIGMDTSTLWQSVATTSNQFKWYGGPTLAATLTGLGAFTTVGQISAPILSASGNIYTNSTFFAQSGGDGQVVIGGDGVGAIEIGKQGRSAASTPYIDFHSSTTNSDFDARIQASGGTATSGAGNLTLTAATTYFTGNASATGQLYAQADVVSARLGAPTTGAIYFGNTASKYLFYDGANFFLQGGQLIVTGNQQIQKTVAGGVGGSLVFTNTSNTINSETVITFSPNVNSDPVRSAQIAGINSDGGNGTKLVFRTNVSGSGPTDRLTIADNGNSTFTGQVTATQFNGNATGVVGQFQYGATTNQYGACRLFRRDTNDQYNVQTNYDGSRWLLRGYYGDTFHAECRVSYSDTTGSISGISNANLARYDLGGTFTVGQNFNSSQNTSYGGQVGTLCAYGTGGSGATMSFHRPGAYAINMGLDSDNVFRIGGWSASVNALQLDGSGNLTALGNIGAYSDATLKENVETIENALDKVCAMRGVTFDVIASGARSSGVIAQEFEPHAPELVATDADGIKSVIYGNTAGYFIEAIKDLKEMIDGQAEVMSAQRSMIEEMRAEIAALKGAR